jgi:ABC-type multidrug transport system fused ATPase/permease subunit
MTDFLRQLWGFTRPYRGRLLLGLLCGVLFGLVNGALIGAVKIVIQLVFEGKTDLHFQLENAPTWILPFSHRFAAMVPELRAPAPNDRVGWLLVVAVIPAIMLLRNALQYLSTYLTNWSAMRAIADIRTQLFAHLQNLSLGFFSRASTGDLIARITNDTQVLYGIIGGSFASVVKDPVTIVCLIVYQLATNTTLTLISIVVFPVCILPIIFYGRKVRKSARAVQQYNAELTNLMHESFTGNRVIKAYNLENNVIEKFRETTKKYVGQMMRVVRANEIPSQLMEIFGGLGIALVFLYVVSLPRGQQPKASDFFAFILTIAMIYPPVKSLTKLHQARAASERVFELLATSNSVPEPVSPVVLKADHADIEFENVDFNYGDKSVLSGINLTVKAGQLIALVGSSGSGKTTLANLLLRFFDPARGRVKIGGVDIRNVSTNDLRNQIAVVTQKASCSMIPFYAISSLDGLVPPKTKLSPRRNMRTLMISSDKGRMACARSLVRKALRFRAASASASPSHARS